MNFLSNQGTRLLLASRKVNSRETSKRVDICGGTKLNYIILHAQLLTMKNEIDFVLFFCTNLADRKLELAVVLSFRLKININSKLQHEIKIVNWNLSCSLTSYISQLYPKFILFNPWFKNSPKPCALGILLAPSHQYSYTIV